MSFESSNFAPLSNDNLEFVPWCNGSTRVFGSLSPRSNRSGTTVKELNKSLIYV